MCYKALILLKLCYFIQRVLADTNSVVVPCKLNDVACMTRSAHLVVSYIAAGIPSLNVDPIDPLRKEDEVIIISDLTASYKDKVIKGFSKCDISDINLNLKALKLIFNLDCPLIEIDAHLELNGKFFGLLIEGNDNLKVELEHVLINVEADIAIIYGSDDKTHMSIKTFKVIGLPRGTRQIDYKNFYVKQKLSPPEAELNLESKITQEILTLSIPSFLHKSFECIFKNVNSFLVTIPFDDLFIESSSFSSLDQC